MCWTLFESIGHSLKNLSPSQKTLRHPWCPNLLVTGLRVPVIVCVLKPLRTHTMWLIAGGNLFSGSFQSQQKVLKKTVK